MRFVDFAKLEERRQLNLLFPGWKKGEGVAFFSPHDDDAILGAGYLILAAVRADAIPYILVFCRGDAGYSTCRQKKDIVGKRRKEASRAYAALGVPAGNVRFFDIPDFSLLAHLERRPPWGKGVFDQIISTLRRERVSRVVVSSGFREHWDHTAVFKAGIYICPQAQDPILAELGSPFPIKTYLAYSVWGEFEPASAGQKTRADLGILADEEEERRVIGAIRSFSSQSRIIKDIVAQRKKRKTQGEYLELYKSFRLRRPIDYAPYFAIVKRLGR